METVNVWSAQIASLPEVTPHSPRPKLPSR